MQRCVAAMSKRTWFGYGEDAKLKAEKLLRNSNDGGSSALHNAVGCGEYALARALLRAGARVDPLGESRQFSQSALSRPTGETALHVAIKALDSDLVAEILENDANPERPDDLERCPMDCAMNLESCGEFKAAAARLDAFASSSRVPALVEDWEEAVRLDAEFLQGRISPLYEEITRRSDEIVRHLLDAGAWPGAQIMPFEEVCHPSSLNCISHVFFIGVDFAARFFLIASDALSSQAIPMLHRADIVPPPTFLAGLRRANPRPRCTHGTSRRSPQHHAEPALWVCFPRSAKPK